MVPKDLESRKLQLVRVIPGSLVDRHFLENLRVLVLRPLLESRQDPVDQPVQEYLKIQRIPEVPFRQRFRSVPRAQ